MLALVGHSSCGLTTRQQYVVELLYTTYDDCVVYLVIQYHSYC